MIEKTKLIFHPIRMRLLTELGGRQMTTRQLAAALPDVALATLYRHIKQLHGGGLIEIVAEERGDGAVERTYAIVDGRVRIAPEELAGISPESHIHYFSLFAAGLIDTFSRYVTNAESPADGISYNRAVIYLSDSERDQLREQLNALLGPILDQEPSPERKRYTLASVVVPDERSD